MGIPSLPSQGFFYVCHKCGAGYTTAEELNNHYTMCMGVLFPLGTLPLGVIHPAIQYTWQSHTASTPQEPLEYSGVPEPLDLIGWRWWQITELGYLESVSQSTIWLPGQVISGEEIDDYNEIGVHSHKTLDDALGYQADPPCALGTVKMWGIVIECETGYRAQHARIVSLEQVAIDEKFWSKKNQRALDYLRKRYVLNEEDE
jgi:hypothetical protein